MPNTQSDSYSSRPAPVTPRKIKSGPPLNWISGAFRLLCQHWSVILPAYFLVILVSALVQFGTFGLIVDGKPAMTTLAVTASLLLIFVLNAGIVAVFHGVAEGRARLWDVFSGFRGHSLLHIVLMLIFMALLILAGVGIGFALISSLVTPGAGFSTGQLENFMNEDAGTQSVMLWIMLMVTAGLGAFAVFAALFCYVIPLIVVTRRGVFGAMIDSFRASFRNLFVLFFFAVNAIVFSQLLTFPLFFVGASSASVAIMGVIAVLVWLVWGAVLSGAYYLSFRDVLLADAPQSGERPQQ